MDTKLSRHVAELNRQAFVVDAHFDLPWDVANQRERGRRQVIATQYLERFREGGFNLIVAAIFIENFFLPEMGLRRALDQISHLAEELDELSESIVLCRCLEDIRQTESSERIGLLLSLEGADPLQNDLQLLRIFYDLGVRGLGLTWSRRNYAADGCAFTTAAGDRPGGLTSFGRDLVEKAEKLGMLIDVSHLNEAGFRDVMEVAQTPVIASHSNCRALTDTPRNLKDEQIEALAACEGVMGMNAISAFVGDDTRKRGVDDLLDHVDHVVKIAGIRHVGIGFDFCSGFQDYLSLPHPIETYDILPGHHHLKEFTAGLIRRGYCDEDIQLVLGGNFMRVYEQVLK
ncbi:MAG: dipeptidase [Desulfosarcina sp.]|nr:dipeptidase [Desulfobacterales bacterium]